MLNFQVVAPSNSYLGHRKAVIIHRENNRRFIAMCLNLAQWHKFLLSLHLFPEKQQSLLSQANWGRLEMKPHKNCENPKEKTESTSKQNKSRQYTGAGHSFAALLETVWRR